MPQELKVSETVTLVRHETASAFINDSVLYPLNGGASALSFDRTFHELSHGVVRPRLNESSMDPDLLAGLNDLETSQKQLYKNWGVLEVSYSGAVENSFIAAQNTKESSNHLDIPINNASSRLL